MLALYQAVCSTGVYLNLTATLGGRWYYHINDKPETATRSHLFHTARSRSQGRSQGLSGFQTQAPNTHYTLQRTVNSNDVDLFSTVEYDDFVTTDNLYLWKGRCCFELDRWNMACFVHKSLFLNFLYSFCFMEKEVNTSPWKKMDYSYFLVHEDMYSKCYKHKTMTSLLINSWIFKYLVLNSMVPDNIGDGGTIN